MDKLILGCGYLGGRVARLWQAQGHRVFAATRSKQRARELSQHGLEPIVCDVLDPISLRSLPAVAAVFYGISLDRRSGRTMREVYVEGLRHVLAQLPPTAKFLYISSTGVYGQTDGEVVDESAATEPLEESGTVIVEAEHLLRKSWPGAVILRFAGIYGPGRLLRRQAIEAGEPHTGNPDRWLNLIHVADGAAIVLAAEEHARPGEIYNVCDDDPPRRGAFYSCLAKLLGAPEPRFVPVTPGMPEPTHERTHRRISNGKLKKELAVSFQYPSFREGIPASIETA